VPRRVGTRSGWAQVSAGGGHTCAIRTNNTLWCWGVNFAGQLGLGDTRTRFVPHEVGTRSGWAQVSAGGDHTCAIRTNNTLWCWGGQLRGGTRTRRHDGPFCAPPGRHSTKLGPRRYR
jgi:alpha-tubulin suppressor-like RCC1 family protein